MVADAAGSVGVLVAGGLILLTGDGYWDTIVALAIGLFVAVRATMLGREVLAVLGQHVPANMDLDMVIADLEGVEGVADVHDFHAWTLTSGMNVATAHLVLAGDAVPETVLNHSRTVLRQRHDVQHATLQVESAASRECQESTW